MDPLNIFPHLNASLNGISSVFLILGLVFILKRKISQHRLCMLAASSVSVLFLISYAAHHIIRTSVYGIGPTRFSGDGLARPVYFTILTSHTILATLVAPFVVATLWRAVKGRYEAHRKLARLVYPVWLYVSITGVAVYLMLYHFFPSN